MDEKEDRWDKALKIKTTGRDDSEADQYYYPYEPTPYSVLERVANTGLIRKGNTLLDYGCGKGRVDCFLSYQTRCCSIGIEYDERIYKKAVENKACAVSGARVKIEHANAEHFLIPEEVDCIYFFSVTIIIILISDIIIAYFFILRKSFGRKKPLIKLEKMVFALALGIYLLNSLAGISQILNRQISEKRFYEVIDNNKVVITNYEGKFLVMDCGVQGEILNIEKGKYYFIEMTNVDVQYKKYKDVKCK